MSALRLIVHRLVDSLTVQTLTAAAMALLPFPCEAFVFFAAWPFPRKRPFGIRKYKPGTLWKKRGLRV